MLEDVFLRHLMWKTSNHT